MVQVSSSVSCAPEAETFQSGYDCRSLEKVSSEHKVQNVVQLGDPIW